MICQLCGIWRAQTPLDTLCLVVNWLHPQELLIYRDLLHFLEEDDLVLCVRCCHGAILQVHAAQLNKTVHTASRTELTKSLATYRQALREKGQISMILSSGSARIRDGPPMQIYVEPSLPSADDISEVSYPFARRTAPTSPLPENFESGKENFLPPSLQSLTPGRSFSISTLQETVESPGSANGTGLTTSSPAKS